MRFGLVEFANCAVGVCTRHIEIPENNRIQSIGGTKISQDIFNGPLRRDIGVDGMLFAVFIQHNIILVDCRIKVDKFVNENPFNNNNVWNLPAYCYCDIFN